ncbi:MAG: AAA family ATPase [Anaerolineae bacterium]
MDQPRFRLPIVRRIVLRGFSLYTRRPEIDLLAPPGVFCIVGANGLGKSTVID